MLRGLFAIQTECKTCGIPRLSEKHAQACSGIDVDIFLMFGQWKSVSLAFYALLSLCTPWSIESDLSSVFDEIGWNLLNN